MTADPTPKRLPDPAIFVQHTPDPRRPTADTPTPDIVERANDPNVRRLVDSNVGALLSDLTAEIERLQARLDGHHGSDQKYCFSCGDLAAAAPSEEET